jgi:3-oxoisoapionate kinase
VRYRLVYYGDDFTGSTDVLEVLTLGGIETVLLLEPLAPSEIQQRFPDAQAVGLAGTSRSLRSTEMRTVLSEVYSYLARFDTPVVHYKVCSTFDSSPTVGSIGLALELGLEVFPSRPVPMVVGAPALKRYVAFGNLFATVAGETYRLDRHPTMRQHPVTPMHESDLRLHLREQTALQVALCDVLALESENVNERLNALKNADAILFDTLNQAHLETIGALLTTWSAGPQLWVGSSGMEYALIAHLKAVGESQAKRLDTVPAVEQTVVMSGSASPATAAQIAWAEASGFAALRLDTCELLDPDRSAAAIEQYLAQSLHYLRAGKSLVLYTAKGPTDPAIAATRDYLQVQGIDPQQVGHLLGGQQGILLRRLLECYPLQRVCVSGGDTCGHAVQQLGLTALELLMPIAPGSPLCKAHAKVPQFDGLEIALKAGQVGQDDYFGTILSGRIKET